MACTYLEGTVTRSGRDIVIYIPKRFRADAEKLLGKRIRMLVVDDTGG